MKRICIQLILLLFITNTIFADEFVVKSFKETSHDITARKNPRKDVNDELCALIKVRTDLDGLHFNSNIGIEGDIDFKGGEYRIYVSPGERQLQIMKDGFIKLSYSIPVKIKSSTVYVMEVTNKYKNDIAGAETLPVTIRFIPNDALLFIDDKPVTGNTHNLAPGKHTLRIEKDGYEEKEETITIDEKNVFFEWQLNKNSDGGLFLETINYGIEMVFVKGGTFVIGCTNEQSNCDNDEKPIHGVTLSDFFIGKNEVTQKQWQEIMGNNPSKFKDCSNCPVEQVSWNHVQEFITKLNQKTGKNYRLPTEAEWEYAVRGGVETNNQASLYSGSNNIDEVAWYYKNSERKTHPVGQKNENRLGIYDMSGNVWEWCSDWYHRKYYKNSIGSNPQGPSNGSRRVRRGGSWFNHFIHLCRVSKRDHQNPDKGNYDLGFRLALDP